MGHKHALIALLVYSSVFSATTQKCNVELYESATTADGGRLIVSGPSATYQNATLEAFIELPPETDSCSEGPVAAGFTVTTPSTVFEWLGSLPNEMETMYNITDAPENCKENALAPGCIPPNDLIPLIFPGTNTTFNPLIWVGLNWNPLGHPPLEVFNRAHFDVHLFMVPKEDVDAIVPSQEEPCTEGLSPESFFKANQPVPVGCFPKGYANLNAVAPFMGNHYINLAEPVVAAAGAGSPDPSLWVDPSFIVGGYDGKITFLEPMVRITQLQDLAREEGSKCYPAGVPAQFPVSGFYPSTFCINTTDTTMAVTVNAFKFQDGGCGADLDSMSYINSALELPSYCKAPLYEAKGDGTVPRAEQPEPANAEEPASSPATISTVLTSLALSASCLVLMI
jgi:hypothetical protein